MAVKIKKRYFSLAAILWTGLIAYLLLSPDPEVGKTLYFKGQDKAAHVILFLVWGFLVYLVRSRYSKEIDFKAVLVVLVLASGLAILTEWIQDFIPNRSSDATDFLFDLVGSVLGISFGYFVKKELIRAEKKFDK